MSRDWAGRLVSLGGVLLVWQLVAISGWLPTTYFPGVPEILSAAGELLADPEFWRNETYTLLRAGAGFVLAMLIALALAGMAARWDIVNHALAPLVELFRSMPPAPLVPLAIFALGLGPRLYLFIIAFASLWPIYIGACNALSSPEPVQVQSARSLGLSETAILWRVRLPAALPEIFSALRIAAGVSLLATIAAEMLAGSDGLGAMLFQSAFALRTPETFGLLLVAGLNGMLFNGLLASVRKVWVGWHDGLADTVRA